MADVRLTVATASVSLAELRATSYLPEAHPPSGFSHVWIRMRVRNSTGVPVS